MTNYVLTHQDFVLPDFVDDTYKIITDGTELQNNYNLPVIKADNELAPMKWCYSEGFMIYDIWKKYTDSDYISINHYRRYFQSIKPENTLPPKWFFDIYRQYACCHNGEDLLKVKGIINTYYPEYDTNGSDGLFTCNMSILDRDTFNDYCKFVFSVLDIFNDKNNLHSDEDVRAYVEKNKIKYKTTFNIDYQSRLHGFLMERVGTIFFNNRFKDRPVRFNSYIQTNLHS